MRKTILVLSLLVSVSAYAAVQRFNTDAKWRTQQMVEKQSVTNPAAAGTADILSGNAGNTSAAAATVSSFVAQPDVPRVVKITPGGTTGDVEACSIVVTGTNINGTVETESVYIDANRSAAVVGTEAFRTISSVVFPANCESGSFGATWSIGYGESLGVKHCLDSAGHIFFSTLNGAKEGTAPTMTADADEVSKNVADYNGTMNGSSDFELFYMQNYRCNP